MFPLDQIAPFFKKQPKPDAQDYLNQVKEELEGGVQMRNDEPKPEVPQIQEREINLTLINDKLNYIISAVNKIAEKEGVDLEE